jgi:RNA polymerase sigma factor (sigma-70 family)
VNTATFVERKKPLGDRNLGTIGGTNSRKARSAQSVATTHEVATGVTRRQPTDSHDSKVHRRMTLDPVTAGLLDLCDEVLSPALLRFLGRHFRGELSDQDRVEVVCDTLSSLILQHQSHKLDCTRGLSARGEVGSVRAALLSWALKSARGGALRLLQKRRRHTSADEASVESLADRSFDECPLESRETYEAVHAIIRRLPLDQRFVLLAFHVEGKSYQEIAAALDRTVSAVKSLLFRARENFRDLWQEEFDEPL